MAASTVENWDASIRSQNAADELEKADDDDFIWESC
jgi:hypothetical protein